MAGRWKRSREAEGLERATGQSGDAWERKLSAQDSQLCVKEGAVVLKAGLVKKLCQEGDSRSQALPFSSSARLTLCRNGRDLQTGTQVWEANSG